MNNTLPFIIEMRFICSYSELMHKFIEQRNLQRLYKAPNISKFKLMVLILVNLKILSGLK
jgi:hypothetical protein